MKNGVGTLSFFIVFFMLLTLITYQGRGSQSDKSDSSHIHLDEEGMKGEVGMMLYPTGSRIPDCTHACGPCYPCKRVMVSFKCTLTESCPIVYRCLCKGRYYHVPSN